MWKLILIFSVFAHNVVSYEIEEITLPPLTLPEGLHWDADTKNLYFTDFGSENATICRFSYETNKTSCAFIEGETGATFVIPLKCCNHHFAVGIGNALKVIKWSGKTKTAKFIRNAFLIETKVPSFMNTGIADSKGRFYGGTYNISICGAPSIYSLYKYSKNNLNELVGNFQTTGGIAIDENRQKLYHLDSCSGIVEFDWNPDTGNIDNARDMYTFYENTSTFHLIGLNIDTEGRLYSGHFGSSKIMIIDPKKSSVVDEIELPTEIILTPTFGGPNMDELFVTSGRNMLNWLTGEPLDLKLSPSAGKLFRISGLGAKGFPGQRACL